MTDQAPVTDNKNVTTAITKAFTAQSDLIPAVVVVAAAAQVANSRKK